MGPSIAISSASTSARLIECGKRVAKAARVNGIAAVLPGASQILAAIHLASIAHSVTVSTHHESRRNSATRRRGGCGTIDSARPAPLILPPSIPSCPPCPPSTHRYTVIAIHFCPSFLHQLSPHYTRNVPHLTLALALTLTRSRSHSPSLTLTLTLTPTSHIHSILPPIYTPSLSPTKTKMAGAFSSHLRTHSPLTSPLEELHPRQDHLKMRWPTAWHHLHA